MGDLGGVHAVGMITAQESGKSRYGRIVLTANLRAVWQQAFTAQDWDDGKTIPDGWVFDSVSNCFLPPYPKPDFMADWLAFQAAEREERANTLPAFPGSWPPKVGLEFPR